MTRDSIFERICFIIREQLNQAKLEITKETSLHDDLGVDSIALMEFVISLEDEFGLEISDEDVEEMTSMGDMLDYLDKRLNK